VSEVSIIEDVLSASVVIAAAGDIGVGLGAVVRVSDVALGGDRSRTYTSAAAVVADTAALDADTVAAGQAHFAQSPAGSQFIVVRIDVGGGEGYDDALAAAEAAGLQPGFDFVFVTIDSRTAASIVEAATYCASRRCIFIAQSADADWLTSSVPSGFSSIVTNQKTAVLYEDTDAQPDDSRWAGRYAGFVPSAFRPSPRMRLAGLSAYGSALTSTQKGHLADNNANWHQVETPGGSQRAIRNGVVLDGTKLELVYTKIYAELQIVNALGATISRAAAAGRDIPADAEGEAVVLGDVAGVLDALLAAGYLTTSEAYPTGYTLSASITGSTITITGVILSVLGLTDYAVSLTLET